MARLGNYIQHETQTKFNLWKRVLILLGAKVIVKSEIATKGPVEIIHTEAKDQIKFTGLLGKLWHKRQE